jgi:protein-S-isoprenylcysteine O-methyltransferase Ste14
VVRIGQFFFRYRDYIFPLFLLPLAFLLRPHITQGTSEMDIRMDIAGVAVALVGQVIRGLAIGFVYIVRGGKNRQIYADTLVEGGMFALCRNPLYVGNFLIVLGLIMVHNSPLAYLIALPFFAFVYYSIVRAEEVFLTDRFGVEYQKYCRRVPRFVPRLRGLFAPFHGLRFDWKKLIRKEYGTTFAWVGGMLLLFIWEDAANRNLQVRTANSYKLIEIAWVLLICGYVTARILKKRGVLGSG